ncbi:MAG: nitrous oxide reductase family maturation protein NosD [Devosiaceae bacterium]
MIGIRRFALAFVCLLTGLGLGLAQAGEVRVPAQIGALSMAIAAANAGDVLILAPGRHDGPVVLDIPVTLQGEGEVLLEGNGTGSVITVTAADVVIRGLEIRGSGDNHPEIDSGIKLDRTAVNALVEDNVLIENHVGIHVFGARDSIVRGNTIVGRQLARMNDRGNGIYVWNAPGTIVEDNDIRFGRDGLFINTSRDNIFRNNIMRDLRFAVHFMYANSSEVVGNTSIGNTMGFAIMFSERVQVIDNLSLRDQNYGVMLNYANYAEVRGNLVRGGTTQKCVFVYNTHRAILFGNRFEACQIGIHFTAGSEGNAMLNNAFIANQTQVQYVGTRDVEWSHDGIGNYWSDHSAFDLNADGVADTRFRPNDLMDHILWSQPSASLLMSSPAVQLIRWSQANFPATLPGGVVDSFPLTRPITIDVPEPVVAMEAAAPGVGEARRQEYETFDPLARH